jgi:glycerophosphoryl diester phosphodiesterase
VLGALLTLAVLGLGSAAGSRPATLVAAHRGGAALWAENSLLAFRNAIALGVDAIEFDLHMTADGEIVVLHDPTLERTTPGSGFLRDLRLAELAPLRLKGPDGTVTSERIPTFAQVLDLVVERPTSVELLPEIQVDGSLQRYAGIEEKVRALLPRARSMFLVGR